MAWYCNGTNFNYIATLQVVNTDVARSRALCSDTSVFLLYWINSSRFDYSFTTNHHHHDSSNSSSDACPVKAYPSFSFYRLICSSRLCLLLSTSSGRRRSSRIWNRNWYWYVASLCRSFQTKAVDNLLLTDLGTT